MNHLKIILLCGSRFALPALKELVFFRLVVAVAVPRHCEEMVENLQHVLNGTGVPVLPLDENSFVAQVGDAIRQYDVNMGLVMTFSYKIPSSIYQLPEKGFYNVHPGPLPKYRGADPVFQQIINREKQAGVTIHKLGQGMDTGDVVMMEMLKLEPSDTHGTLTSKLAQLAARLIAILVKLATLDLAIPSRPQDKTQARYFKRQSAADISVNWMTMDADEIIALINACNPWNKGAVTKINNQIIRLLQAEKISSHASLQKEPGYIISVVGSGMLVTTLHDEAINIGMTYMDEGFLLAHRLADLGFSAGSRFENI